MGAGFWDRWRNTTKWVGKRRRHGKLGQNKNIKSYAAWVRYYAQWQKVDSWLKTHFAGNHNADAVQGMPNDGAKD